MKRLDAFVKKWFAEPDGGNPSRGSWTFADAAQFEEMLEDHLRALAARWVDGAANRDGGLDHFIKEVLGAPYLR